MRAQASAMMRDLPTPASPETTSTCPLPAAACFQHRRISAT